ncbi:MULTISPECIES: hypothetical protein [Flavobacterium]|uniref:hypothetical protein n=1 Tax=Flavobacterium TaxID=237 RepID=UPI001FCB36D1|nr:MULTISPECIES: hypothetical protein [Flavobacterium]UOK43401.1 hypothetical protein LZF87_04590 [Flavobacterium enshiense]
MQDFLCLSEEIQNDTVWNTAKFLESYEDDKYRYNLYALSDFFIEIKYDIIRNTILERIAFKHVELLDKYLFK